MAAMTLVAVTLDQISSTRTSRAADHNALFTTDQSAADTTDDRADDGPLGAAVVYTPVTALTEAVRNQRAEY